ncbi:hypothetical protein CRENBAI_021434 [Crenichthys baileyi]|uniref:Uncharacterized protein n=1 Tax=Crenichthys baileyi TaxID=28760 RepID=A0AAV9RX01_9TELE
MRLRSLLRKWCRNQKPAVLPDQTKDWLGPCDQISINPQVSGLGLKDVTDLLPKPWPPPHPADMAVHTRKYASTH